MLKFAFFNLLRRKSRTFLSIFMIAVGVLSIISLVALVDGLFLDVQSATSSLQGIMVLQGDYGPVFSQVDSDIKSELESFQGVDKVEPVILTTAKSIEGVSSGFDFSGITRLIGSDFSSASTGQTVSAVQGEIILGRQMKPSDRGKVMIGEEIKEIYNKFPGNNIKINGEKYSIVGVYKTGSKQINTGVIMHIEDLRDLIGFPKGKVSYFSVTVQDPSKIDNIVTLMEFKFGDDFDILNTSQFAESLGSVLGNIRLMAFAVAAIAGIVAGVGIINTMLMSVMERFREIGALKATGWTNENVMRMIVTEAFLIGVIGGISGILISLAITPIMADITGFKVFVSPDLMMETFAFAVGVGVIAGLYPAWRASKFDPIDALRME